MKVFTSEELVDVAERQQGYFTLYDNYPNPFGQHTYIDYELQSPAHVSLEIFDLNGRLVNHLVSQYQTAGSYSVYWCGDDRSGNMVTDGIYICRIKAGAFTRSITMMLHR